jgi:hypothetical protein
MHPHDVSTACPFEDEPAKTKSRRMSATARKSAAMVDRAQDARWHQRE